MALRRITTLFLGAFVAAAALAPVSRAAVAPPQTGFEKNNGAAWTTHEEELSFLAEVDALSERVSVDVIGKTKEGRPLHLVKLGDPAPHARAAPPMGSRRSFTCAANTETSRPVARRVSNCCGI